MSILVKGIHHPLYGELSSIVGPKYCSDDDFERICYSKDSSPAPSQVQGIVVRPANIEQVVAIVKLANYARTPIVPSGGRAALYGAPPGLIGKGIVVDMTRMRKVLKIDEENAVVTVEAGCTLAELWEACHAKGWDVHTAMQPYFADTVGGQISGVLGAGLGLEGTGKSWNTHHICGLKVVLPNGDVLQTGAGPGTNIVQKVPFAREPGGPDITGMFIGDAGVFGIKVEATYRMFRYAKYTDGVIGVFNNKDDAFDHAFEMAEVEPAFIAEQCVVPPTHTMVNQGVPPGWYLCLDIVKGNDEEEVAKKVAFLTEKVKQRNGIATDDPQVKGWIHDAASGERHREMGSFASLGVWTYLELMCPGSEVKDCMEFIWHVHADRLEAEKIPFEHNLGCVTVGGVNQWIVSGIIFLKGYEKRYMDVMHELWKEGLVMGAAKGWYPDANQGWGSIAMAKYWPPTTVTFMRTIKNALDPNNIMNPGLWCL